MTWICTAPDTTHLRSQCYVTNPDTALRCQLCDAMMTTSQIADALLRSDQRRRLGDVVGPTAARPMIMSVSQPVNWEITSATAPSFPIVVGPGYGIQLVEAHEDQSMTVNPCRHCGVNVEGGPTACEECVSKPKKDLWQHLRD